jgi:nucleoside-diphosphate-sugar epimerase
MKVWVTGANGFLGKYVVKELLERGYEVGGPTHREVDLQSTLDVREYFVKFKPDSVIHLAALCGGIGANSMSPGEFYYKNIMMGTRLIEEARWYVKKKFVSIGTVCSYPKHTPVPFKEDHLWNGYPEETNAPYGLAKKMQLVQLQAYREQYGFQGIYLIPVNLYGPGDDFKEQSSHVIPAIIRKIDDAIGKGLNKVELWGTGFATREFLFVEDCARGICDALEKYDDPRPMNLGTGEDIKIMDLADTIKNLMGYKGFFKWDKSKPDGQPIRVLDISRAKKRIDWNPVTSLKQGLKATIEWWRNHATD